MDNPEKLATFSMQDTGRIHTKQKKQHNTENQNDEQHGPHQKPGDEYRRPRRATGPIKNQGMNTGGGEEQRTPSKTRGWTQAPAKSNGPHQKPGDEHRRPRRATDPIKKQGMNTGTREEQQTPSKTRGWTQAPTKSKQFLYRIDISRGTRIVSMCWTQLCANLHK